MEKNTGSHLQRRNFLGMFSSILGLSAIGYPVSGKSPEPNQDVNDVETWFNKLKGKHKMVFDTISPINGYQVVWPLTFLESNNKTGTPDSELSALVVLRNKAIVLALEDRIWKKYKLGKFYGVTDPVINATADRNLYWDPPAGEMPEPGTSIKELMARGVLFCVCEKAMTLNSGQIAKSKNLDPAEVKKDWLDGVLPGIQRVPSGVWALNRAQEHGASYCYAG